MSPDDSDARGRGPQNGLRHASRRLVGAALLLSAAFVAGCERAPAGPAATDRQSPGTSARTNENGDAAHALLGAWTAEVARGVHLLGRTFPNASYVIETSDGLVLVDTCPQVDAEPILSQLSDLGLDAKRIRKVLLTHGHADHCLGAQRLRELSGAQVCIGRADAAVVREGGPREALFSIFEMPQDLHTTKVDVELADGDVVRVGDTEIRAVATPGHTPGSTCYLLERDGLRILFTGDVVMSLTDPAPLSGAGIYSAYLAPCYRGDAQAYLASLKTLLAMPAPDVVLPGHPRLDLTPANPHMPRAAWEALLGRAVERLEVLVARHTADGSDFLDGEPKPLLPGLHYLGDVEQHAAYLLAAPDGRTYLFGGHGGPSLAKTLAERCAALGIPPLRPTAVLLTSCAPDAVSGIASLVDATGCAVVAPAKGLADVTALCPPNTVVHAAESLPALGWFPVEVVPIEGAAHASVVYAVRQGGKCILVSGCVPTRIEPFESADRRRALSKRVREPSAFRKTLDRLEGLDPDLWLPSVPRRRPNANLYDGEWANVVRSNRW